MSELVLPLVVRIERSTPPSRTDALEAAPRAVLFMLTDERPEWREAIEAWDGARIRKVVRRARGAEWHRASALPGITVQHRTAEVRAYAPIPIDAWPRDLARLQVKATNIDDREPPPAPPPGMPLVLLSAHLEMSAGKAMAQASHAAQLGYRSMNAAQRAAWAEHDFELAVRDASPHQWASALATDAPVVHDAGFTELAPGSQTALFVTGGYTSD